MRKAYVYCIFARPSYRFKIGWAFDPVKRMKSLQTSSPENLLIAGFQEFESKEQAMEAENRLHVSLQRMCLQREWFEPNPNAIVSLCKKGMLGRLSTTYMKEASEAFTNGWMASFEKRVKPLILGCTPCTTDSSSYGGA